MVDWTALIVFIIFFALVTILGFLAARWRQADLNTIHEWGLAGGRFGTVVSWFLLGGDLYTAYTFIAVPALVYGKGALGFFALPYTIITYPFVFVVMPRLWSVARAHGYVTAADFVRDRFSSHWLALAVAATGIVATMPYIALQMFGIEVVIAQMGVNVEISLIIAFLILAAYTYVSGLRAPALIAVVKDTMIWITVIVVIAYVPAHLGGFGHIFHVISAMKPKTTPAGPVLPPSVVLPGAQFWAFSTLAFGSALALFLYPHAITGVLATENRNVLKRNMALLPIFTFMLGLIALFGFLAIAAGVHPSANYKANSVVPALIAKEFPSWFAGFAFAAIGIGALVPASIMSIAAANLFTRNIWREYARRTVSAHEETRVAKIVSLLVKVGALLFILAAPAQYAIDFQLLGSAWILQTLPSLILGLYTRWFHRTALLIGWAAGLITATYWAAASPTVVAPARFTSTYPFHLGGHIYVVYVALAGLAINLVLSAVLTPIFNALGAGRGEDRTAPSDYLATAAVPAGQ
ncbi:MAG: sodium:solute symporter [Chloroflexi bacterium]|nr:sodium:solute symporter [Chloroflexota bacterium]